MVDHFLQFDRHLFYVINHDMANPFFDRLMPWLRTPTNWVPLYIIIITFCLWVYKKKGMVIILFIALSAGFADFTSASIIKPLVKRDRPCRDSISAKTDIERSGCGPGYSFPSTHATDHFAMAFFVILLFYKRWPWLWLWGILWAGLISFAQVYVGLHYPADVFFGALYGALAGWLFAVLFKKLQPHFPEWVPVI